MSLCPANRRERAQGEGKGLNLHVNPHLNAGRCGPRKRKGKGSNGGLWKSWHDRCLALILRTVEQKLIEICMIKKIGALGEEKKNGPEGDRNEVCKYKHLNYSNDQGESRKVRSLLLGLNRTSLFDFLCPAA